MTKEVCGSAQGSIRVSDAQHRGRAEPGELSLCACAVRRRAAFAVRCGMCSSVSGLHSVGDQNVYPPPVLTTKNVSGHGQMCSRKIGTPFVGSHWIRGVCTIGRKVLFSAGDPPTHTHTRRREVCLWHPPSCDPNLCLFLCPAPAALSPHDVPALRKRPGLSPSWEPQL